MIDYFNIYNAVPNYIKCIFNIQALSLILPLLKVPQILQPVHRYSPPYRDWTPCVKNQVRIDNLSDSKFILTGPDGAVVMSSAGRYWVRISVPAPTQSGFLNTQWVGVRPLHPLLSH